MKFRNKRRTIKEADINIVPMLDIFVSLIPFLLLTVSFIRFGGLQAEIPKLSDSSSKSQQQEISKKIDLIFMVEQSKINVTGWRDRFTSPVAEINKDFSIDQIEDLKLFITSLKDKAEIGTTLFRASPDMQYDAAIKVLGAVRQHPAVPSVVFAAEAQ